MANPESEIITPTEEDLEELLALMNDPRSIHRQVACLHGERLETASQLYERLMEDNNLALMVGDRPVGFASWQQYGRHAHLNVMMIGGDFQRRGFGKRLFGAFLDALAGQGVVSVSLRAYRDSDWAINFYEGLGMRRFEVGDEHRLGAGGLLQYIQLAAAHGLWPAEDKVMLVGELDVPT
jgi:ribosomal protein S18 acetylase RimI-like enzyme